ncbi:MAG: hypothetical protein KC431_26345, partial [Myxococcales bacterium]|nr:hypothetical protein [Myxococcales bacterium]
MSAEPPESGRDDDGSAPADATEPAVGNVLGFSLLFRERRALLALNRRSLAPGVRLRDYEAAIPGVGFPLRGPLMATKFRSRRCRLVRAVISIEERALRPWLRARLLDQELAGVRVRDVDLDLRRELPAAERPRPCLMISGENIGGGRFWLLVAFDVDPAHRLLLLRPCRLWLLGESGRARSGEEFSSSSSSSASVDVHGRDLGARRLWLALARRLAAGTVAGVSGALAVGEDGSLRVDPGRLALTRAFASVGWKAPNLEGSAVSEFGLTRRAVTVEL